RGPAQRQRWLAPRARASAIVCRARSTLVMAERSRDVGSFQSEERLHLLALLAQLVELAVEPRLRDQTGAGTDAHVLPLPLHVADGHERERAAVFALQPD